MVLNKNKKLMHLLSLDGVRLTKELELAAPSVATLYLHGCANIVHGEKSVWSDGCGSCREVSTGTTGYGIFGLDSFCTRQVQESVVVASNFQHSYTHKLVCVLTPRNEDLGEQRELLVVAMVALFFLLRKNAV